MKILLLSAYDAVSHRYWREGLVENFPEHQWTQLTLPPRYFSWRIRGNSLSWAFGEQALLNQAYDRVLATSMVDLTALRGFVPALARIPTLVYFHENQFDYPASGNEYQSVEPRILNIYNALCADRVLFNSAYNRDTLLEGAARLLKKLPDQVPPGLIESIRARARVVPVPLPQSVFLPAQAQPGPLELVWNHRWEFDKGPDLLLAAVTELQRRGVPFKLHVVGQRFRSVPAAFAQLKPLLRDRGQLGCWGPVESVAEYRQLLQRCDVVLSTALHDFQGISVLEAVAAGCSPLVPDRLAYPELFPESCRYRAGEGEIMALVEKVSQLAQMKANGDSLPVPDVSQLGWPVMKAVWQSALSAN